MGYLRDASAFAKEHGLRTHLDGARVFNAAVKLGVSCEDICHHFDSVSICLSKGLGAPVGSVLCAGRNQIAIARKWRKMLGGGMRQAGILAAAGIYALKNNIERLTADHENATLLAQGLSEIEELRFDPASVQTNMVHVSISGFSLDELKGFMREHGVLIAGRANLRLVTHMDVDESDIHQAIGVFKEFFAAG